jgi:hypothetical protein
MSTRGRKRATSPLRAGEDLVAALPKVEHLTLARYLGEAAESLDGCLVRAARHA